MMNVKPSDLVLEDGLLFSGFSPETQNSSFSGELVFTTGMIGYPETLSDPSFAGQILVFTYPLIGNYGMPPPSFWESKTLHVRGVIVSELCQTWSHHEGSESLLEVLERLNIPLMMGVDTRALTKHLRYHGSMPGVIKPKEYKEPLHFTKIIDEHLVSQVSIPKKETTQKGDKVVYLVDCGMKEGIYQALKDLPLTLHRVPYDYDYSNEAYDGVFLSNGPGDPMQCPEAVQILRKAMRNKRPIFGICLGIQLMALAAGASTYKLPFGHRGYNQPCINLKTRQCYITSQNHGYAVDEKTLPPGWEVTHRNINDASVEGIAHQSDPFFAVQFHPEAKPGPEDTHGLFQQFYESL
jgi:carbamoyl-phosphate synthase small subunit